jgi:hypothetical protein
MAHSLLRVALLVPALSALPNVARGAPAHPGLVITEAPACRVVLTKLSYDGPGADDEEFIELFVERTGRVTGDPPTAIDAGSSMPACHAPHPSAESGPSPTDGGVPEEAGLDVASRGLTLGDCGLGELRLVNGGSGACDEYRIIPLGPVRVPDDGYIVVCAQDSVFSSACDVDTAGRSALKNGFLQNGPNDGLSFIDSGGVTRLEIGYEGGPPCFSPAFVAMVDETGETSAGSLDDDVNVVCGSGFVLRPISEVPFRTAATCSTAGAGDAGADVAQRFRSGSGGSASTLPGLEYAPDSGASFSPMFTLPDGSFSAPPRLNSAPIDPTSCRMSAKTTAPSDWIAVAPAVLLFRRRKRQRRAILRADFSARSAIALRRSP